MIVEMYKAAGFVDRLRGVGKQIGDAATKKVEAGKRQVADAARSAGREAADSAAEKAMPHVTAQAAMAGEVGGAAHGRAVVRSGLDELKDQAERHGLKKKLKITGAVAGTALAGVEGHRAYQGNQTRKSNKKLIEALDRNQGKS